MWAPGYPLYQLGGPQLRVFRTNFFIQLVRPGVAQPEDTVQFRIPMEMTRVDLRNYLESIYNVPVAAVRTRVQHGSNRRRDHRNVRIKKPDYKVAYVQLPSQTPSKEQNGQGSTLCFRSSCSKGWTTWGTRDPRLAWSPVSGRSPRKAGSRGPANRIAQDGSLLLKNPRPRVPRREQPATRFPPWRPGILA
ncbi:large ribosomal subunit protein uL23m isoform X2 [Pongo abelii]|uniref:large ribosomal subunit protein uL23m isoform X2 n=1 Tax=Pongo abelii TaxID=9601 RepID=UPI0023E7B80E|nr:39S ribosomal protein L23, mitochondrial isoform X2 [Pongo abelii]